MIGIMNFGDRKLLEKTVQKKCERCRVVHDPCSGSSMGPMQLFGTKMNVRPSRLSTRAISLENSLRRITCSGTWDAMTTSKLASGNGIRGKRPQCMLIPEASSRSHAIRETSNPCKFE